MANSVGSVAKSTSRLCFTFVNVTTPTAPRTPLPTKFAVAEKHMARLLVCENYTCRHRTQIISYDAASDESGGVGEHRLCPRDLGLVTRATVSRTRRPPAKNP